MTAATGPRPHGTRARYVLGPGPGKGPGCRCEACKAANRAEARHRQRQILDGRWAPYVDAQPARDHVRALSAAGVGWKRVAELAGVSTGAMSKLLYGGPGDRPPSRRIRQALVAAGWSQARLARELGLTPANFGAMLRCDQVTAGTARAVSELYDRLWNRPPPEHDQRTRIAASRARRHAAERGWVPPLAWDEDVIDDPDGRPADGWKRPARTNHRSSESAEDAEELFRRDGCTREHAAERLGVSLPALEQALSRARASERERHAQRARFAQAAATAGTPRADYQAEAG